MSQSAAGQELPMILFSNVEEWAAWLDHNYSESAGLWLQLAKKHSGIASLSYAEALDVALCYGWIDGQKRPFDELLWLQKFTRRGSNSIWSKINREKAEALIAAGKMQPAGFAAIERAKENGRWETAYDSHRTSVVPEDFQAELDQNEQASAFFQALDRQNRYAILFRIQTAKKAETRMKRIKQFIEMLERHERLYP